MDTELYKIVHQMVLESGMSMRKFAQTYNISRPWLIAFINPETPFRELSPRTISLLYTGLGIEEKVCRDYNKWVKERQGD